MSQRWRGWNDESTRRKAQFVALWVVVAAVSIIIVAGTLAGDGLESPWVWSGLALVPVLLWLVSLTGFNR